MSSTRDFSTALKDMKSQRKKYRRESWEDTNKVVTYDQGGFLKQKTTLEKRFTLSEADIFADDWVEVIDKA
jgi:hypothetical protein